MAKLTKSEWIRKGFHLLEKEGYHAIKLENLCDKFQVTRGSFYHHFSSMDEYVHGILQYWKDHTLAAFEDIMKKCKTASEKRTRLIAFVYGLSAKAELSVRAWALSNKAVRKYVDYMDKERIKVTAGIYADFGLDKAYALQLAVFANANYLGTQIYCIQNPAEKEKIIQQLADFISHQLSK